MLFLSFEHTYNEVIGLTNFVDNLPGSRIVCFVYLSVYLFVCLFSTQVTIYQYILYQSSLLLQNIPKILDLLIPLIEKEIETEGIYRLSGNVREVRELKEKLLTNPSMDEGEEVSMVR